MRLKIRGAACPQARGFIIVGANHVAVRMLISYNSLMSSSESPDTYIIRCTNQDNRWAAFNLQTRRAGVGSNPKEALADALRLAETVSEPNDPYAYDTAYDLMLTLAKIAQPLPEGEYTSGVVYRYDRA